MGKKQVFYSVVGVILLTLIFCKFILTPMKEDQKNFMVTSYYADISGKVFPSNILESWELKPVGNRLINYIFYKTAIYLANYSQKKLFEVIVLLLYALVSITILAYVVFSCRKILNGMGINRHLAFFILVISYLAVGPEVSMQPEYISVLLFMLAFSLAINKSLLANIFAGLMLAFLLYLKVITIVFCLFAYLFLFALGKKYILNVLRVMFCQAFFMSLLGVLTLVYFPNLLQEFIDTAKFSEVNLSLTRNICRTFRFIPFLVADIPVILVGIPIAILLFFEGFSGSKFKSRVFILGLWIIPLLIAIPQGKGFTYHFSGFIISSVVCILIFLSENILRFNRNLKLITDILFSFFMLSSSLFNLSRCIKTATGERWLLFTAVIIFILAIINSVLLFRKKYFDAFENINNRIIYIGITFFVIWLSLASPLSNRWIAYDKKMKLERAGWETLNKKYPLSLAKNILFLTDGNANYYILTSSYSKYFFPLPLQRSLDNPALLTHRATKEILESVLSYNGEFIINYSGWFPIERFPNIENKIKNEYRLVESVKFADRDVKIFRRIYK